MYNLEDGIGLRDLFVTPFYICILSFIAYWIRPFVTTTKTQRYFLPALWIRFMGAILLGVVYQFHYGGGDTFNYFAHGSRWIWEAFWDDPESAFLLLVDWGGGIRSAETFEYNQHIWYYRDPHSYFIVRITAFFDLFTFHTYTATALFFASFNFSGLWAFYSAVQKKYPQSDKWLAVAVLFVPSVVFWGSGILKDTITLGALGWMTWGFIHMIELRRYGYVYWGAILVSSWLIYSIKAYIIICYVPMIFFWLYWKRIRELKNPVLKILLTPFLIFFFGLVGYFSMIQISSGSKMYSIDSIAERAAITAYDIRYGWGARSGGDGGYDLGELDGTWQSMFRLMPEAINVSLFRPYLWEVKNPLMLLAALEGTIMLVLTLWLLFYRKKYHSLIKDPFLMFCFLFALAFAFAVGVSTFNFGTLMRYKIPLLLFWVVVLIAKKK